MNLIQLHEVASTNSYLRELLSSQPELPEYTLIDTFAQTNGRGQRGNSWESDAGHNVSCSLLIRPREIDYPFDLNIIISLAIRDVLTSYLPAHKIFVKWPNDLLINDRKVAGILIENEWLGTEWSYSIIGIGLNVCQTHFGDYRPQATSLKLEGAILPLAYAKWHNPLLTAITERLQQRRRELIENPEILRREYHNRLFGIHERHLFSLPNGENFEGTIERVLQNGMLQVQTPKGVGLFAFKEIRMII